VQNHDGLGKVLSSSSVVTDGQPDDVPGLLLIKAAVPHQGKDLDAMTATATALKERSLELFKDALKDYQKRESCLRPF
jgi:hypothetical protein